MCLIGVNKNYLKCLNILNISIICIKKGIPGVYPDDMTVEGQNFHQGVV